jgi:PAS domain S-box-containing protein
MGHSPATAFIKDDEGRYVYVNRLLEQQFNRPLAEWVGRTDFDIFPPEQAEQYRQNDRTLLASRATAEFVETVSQPDGLRHYLSFKFCLEGGEGRCLLAGMSLDITDQKRAEEELQRERDLLSVTLASIGDAVITTDTDGRVTNLNAVAESLTGWTSAEAAGRPLDTVFHIVNEETRQPVENPAARALREGIIVGLANHTILIARDGTERPIDDSAAPIRAEGGGLVGCVLVFRDITDRKKAVAALRESEHRYRLVADAANDAIWDWNLVTSEVVWNEGVRSRFGYTAEQVVPDVAWWYEHIHPEDRERVVHGIHALIDSGETGWTDEYRYRRADGSYAYVFDRGRVVHDGAGKPVRMVGSLLDLTERREAEERIRRSEQQLRAVIETTPECIKVVADDGILLWMNPAGLAMVEADPTVSVAGGCVYELIAPEHREAFRIFNERICRGERGVLQFDIIGLRGTRRHMESHAVPLPNPDGSVTQLALTRDVTERKQAEEELARLSAESERQRRLYDTILSNTPDLAYVFDLDHRFTYANQALLTIWGRTWHESTGKNCLELGYPDWHAARHDQEIEQVKGTRQPIRGEVPFTGAQGRRIYDYIFVPVLGVNGEVEAVAGTTRDVTERKQMEDDLRKVAAELSEANRRKTEFLATLGHELRNPLAPIRTGLELMKMLAGDPARMEEVRGTMERQTQQLVRLIDDLLDVSRITQGKLQLRTCRVALTDVVQSAVEASRPLIDEAGQELTLTMPEQPIHLDADPHRLAQVISNLLGNAAKYTPEGGHITLSAEVVRDQESGVTSQKARADAAGHSMSPDFCPRTPHVVVAVKDDGIGIPADMQASIFEMFSQIDRSLENGYTGLGIGLTLVKSLVEMHRGRVEVQSAGEGQGSEFRVWLPILVEPAAKPQPDSSEAADQKLKLRVLVVDDNKAAADMLAMVVKLLGNEVRTAYDGLQGVEAAAEFRPDVVLMDLGMPRMNGYEAARHIREQAWSDGIVLVALTGWGQEEDRQRTREAGFDHHLVKPAEPAALQKLFAECQPRPN